jgi:hypothetical protein
MSLIHNINPEQVIAEYQERKLDQLSDHFLFTQAAEIISKPKDNLNSFDLHAPLELMARYRLLPLVNPEEKHLARIQILATTAVYQNRGASIAVPSQLPQFQHWQDAREQFERAIMAGDVEKSDQISVAIANQFGSRLLIDALASKSIWTLTVASHGHIGVMMAMLLQGDLNSTSLHLLRRIVRGLAAEPQAVLKVSQQEIGSETASNFISNDATIEKILVDEFATIPRIKRPETASIRALMEAAEEEKLLENLCQRVPNLASSQLTHRVFQTCNRTAAYAMLQDNWEDEQGITEAPLDVKYGWTHCLTLPQAGWAIAHVAPSVPNPSLAACMWVLAFRSTIGSKDLDLNAELPKIDLDFHQALLSSPKEAASVAWHAESEQKLAIRAELATQAAIRNDAHLVKYVRACLDLSHFDQAYSHLYDASAAYLCSLWMLEQPRDSLEENITNRSPF